MKTFEVAVGAMRVQAALEPANVETLGVQVHFDPQMPAALRGMSLEQVMLGWKREVGLVARGGEPRAMTKSSVWLPGWTCMVFEQGTVMVMTIRYGD